MLLLPLAARAEIWGMHGREHRTPDGRSTLLRPSPEQYAALEQAEQQLTSGGLGSLLERKVASLALHWRTLGDADHGELRERVHRQALEVFTSLTGHHALGLLAFDGGLELRATDHTKAHATRALLEGSDPRAAVYLGDDTTDEDAFEAINALHGLSFLVREPPRASFACYALQPPGELLAFLDAWLASLAGEHEQ